MAASAAFAWILARRLGEQLARDLRALTAQIRRMHPSDAPIQPEVTAFGRIAHTQAGQRFALRSRGWPSASTRCGRKEREGRLAMEQVQRLRDPILGVDEP